MIYCFPSKEEPIRQGDIFRWIPSVDLSLSKMACLDEENNPDEKDWKSLVPFAPESSILVLVPVRPVLGIVASQDCDSARGKDITFCEIRPFTSFEKSDNPKGWMKIITQHARQNWKWFYLPPDDRLGFKEKMAVDFRLVTKVDRLELESLCALLRVGRLNDVALAHFRERISDFFRRYAYNEWYPLNTEELAEYQKDKKVTVDPVYEWQRPKDAG